MSQSLTPPQLIVIAGPNGAGKSTNAPALLPVGVTYVNADEIAKLLPGDGRDKEITAGRLQIEEWKISK